MRNTKYNMKALKLIKLLRESGLSGQELADSLGTSRATVSKIESGKLRELSMKMLEKAAQKLNKKPAELLAELE
jgi:transcriptional regulator with XRE-family HTH domain